MNCSEDSGAGLLMPFMEGFMREKGGKERGKRNSMISLNESAN